MHTSPKNDIKFRYNGSFDLTFTKPWWLAWLIPQFRVYGGSASTAPTDIPVVSLRENPQTRSGVADIHCPVPDFGIPQPADLPIVQGALIDAFEAGSTVGFLFVGCGAGIGRTGMFLALMVKVAGVTRAPVNWVRHNYLTGAVETDEQFNYIENFDVKTVRRMLFWAMLRHRLGRKRLKS